MARVGEEPRWLTSLTNGMNPRVLRVGLTTGYGGRSAGAQGASDPNQIATASSVVRRTRAAAPDCLPVKLARGDEARHHALTNHGAHRSGRCSATISMDGDVFASSRAPPIAAASRTGTKPARRSAERTSATW